MHVMDVRYSSSVPFCMFPLLLLEVPTFAQTILQAQYQAQPGLLDRLVLQQVLY